LVKLREIVTGRKSLGLRPLGREILTDLGLLMVRS